MTEKQKQSYKIQLGMLTLPKYQKIDNTTNKYNYDKDNNKFIAESVDYQKLVNSANVGTIDSLLEKYGVDSPELIRSLRLLESNNKARETYGTLYDYQGNAIHSITEVKDKRLKYQQAIALYQAEQKNKAIQLNNKDQLIAAELDESAKKGE